MTDIKTNKIIKNRIKKGERKKYTVKVYSILKITHFSKKTEF